MCVYMCEFPWRESSGQRLDDSTKVKWGGRCFLMGRTPLLGRACAHTRTQNILQVYNSYSAVWEMLFRGQNEVFHQYISIYVVRF